MSSVLMSYTMVATFVYESSDFEHETSVTPTFIQTKKPLVYLIYIAYFLYKLLVICFSHLSISLLFTTLKSLIDSLLFPKISY